MSRSLFYFDGKWASVPSFFFTEKANKEKVWRTNELHVYQLLFLFPRGHTQQYFDPAIYADRNRIIKAVATVVLYSARVGKGVRSRPTTQGIPQWITQERMTLTGRTCLSMERVLQSFYFHGETNFALIHLNEKNWNPLY